MGFPCGCGKSPRWSKSQWMVRLMRELKSKGYTFIRLKEEAKVFSNTKVVFRNLHEVREDLTVSQLLSGHGASIKESRDKLSKSKTFKDDIHIQKFLKSGSFPEGTIFERGGKKNLWIVHCPICINDILTLTGYCNGKFKSLTMDLKNGYRPCRCSPCHKNTPEQNLFLLERECLKMGHTLVSCDTPCTANSKFKAICGNCKSLCENNTISDLITSGKFRCPTCKVFKIKLLLRKANFSGYFPTQRGRVDYLYVVLIGEDMIKFGRSFKPTRRLKTIARLSKSTVKLLKLYRSDHETIFKQEQDIFKLLDDLGLNTLTDFTTEAYKLKSLLFYKEVLDFSKLNLVEGI